MKSQENKSKKEIFLKWFKRVGIWGFVFFLAKGLVWLVVGYYAFK